MVRSDVSFQNFDTMTLTYDTYQVPRPQDDVTCKDFPAVLRHPHQVEVNRKDSVRFAAVFSHAGIIQQKRFSRHLKMGGLKASL